MNLDKVWLEYRSSIGVNGSQLYLVMIKKKTKV